MSLVLTNKAGTVTVPEHVLVGIAVRAAESVDGIRVRRRRSVDVAERVQEAVVDALRGMCGIDTVVDVAVGGLE